MFSGINSGSNLGDNIIYSGTVAAAVEGAMLDIPSIAVSLDSHKPIDYNCAKYFSALIVKNVLKNDLPKGVVLNVNIPNVKKPVPLFIVMRALGVISDKSIIEHCILDIDNEKYVELFTPCVYDAGTIFTQQAALNYIKTFTKGKTIPHVYDILMNYFLPHIGELNFK